MENKKQIKEWTFTDWNERLFAFYFERDEGLTSPVTRLVITEATFVRATGLHDLTCHEVTESFKKMIRSRSDDLKRVFLDSPQYQPNPKQDPPEYFLFLLFSCFVASVDENAGDEGNYRKRLGKILDLDEEFQHLPGIREYWQRLAQWLAKKIDEGKGYRALELGEPLKPHLRQIGYAYRLAFPMYRDQEKLSNLLRKPGNFNDDRLIAAELIELMADKNEFSHTFLFEFDAFWRAYQHGDPWENHPFWEAAIDAYVMKNLLPKSKWTSESGRLCLAPDIDWDDLGPALMVNSKKLANNHDVFVLSTPDVLEDYSFKLALNHSDEVGALGAFRAVLNGTIREIVPDLSFSESNHVEIGLLVFSWHLSWITLLSPYEDPEKEMIALVRSDLTDMFLELFPHEKHPTRNETGLDGWSLVKNFRFADLQAMNISPGHCFYYLPWVEKRSSASLVITGGLRLGKRYVGQPGFYPAITMKRADELELEADKGFPKLVRLPAYAPGKFNFKKLQCPMYGTYRIKPRGTAYTLGKIKIRFHNQLVSFNFKGPSNCSEWLIEAGAQNITIQTNHEPGMVHFSDYHTDYLTENDQNIELVEDEAFTTRDQASFYSLTVDDKKLLRRFCEICGRLAISRRGITENQLREIVRGVFGDVIGPSFWGIARAWTEAGFFDHLTSNCWRARSFFPRKPRFAIYRGGSGYRTRLMGLAPPILCDRLKELTKQMGVELIKGRTFSPWLPRPTAIIAGEPGVFEEISRELELEPPMYVLSPIKYKTPPPISETTDEPPLNFEEKGFWDWRSGSFSREVGGGEVDVRWYKGRTQPDYYQIIRNDKSYWWSRSRNWALLVAHRMMTCSPFDFVGSGFIAGTTRGVYLPMDMARYAALIGESFPGPSMEKSNYIYDFRSFSQAQSALRYLGFYKGRQIELSEWLRLKTRVLAGQRSGARLGALPSHLDKWLREQNNPHARSMAGRPVPIFLLNTIHAMYLKTRTHQERI